MWFFGIIKIILELLTGGFLKLEVELRRGIGEEVII